MSTKFLTTTLAAVACAAVVAAQAPPPAQIPAPPSQAPAPTQRVPETRTAPTDNVTVMGCLERSAPGAIGTAGGAGRIDAPAFILTKVMRPAGTPATSSAALASASYRLDADEKKLSEHVGRKVEITGKVADRSADANASKGASSDPPQLKVESVKMIASTCAE
jgi:hypothetical protein